MDNPNITMQEYIRLEEEKSHRLGKVYNWETATYDRIWCNEDVHDRRSVETEFPAIVFDDAFTSEKCPRMNPRCFDDLDFFKDFENEFPAIIYNDALTSKLNFLTKPALSPQHIDESDLKDETSFSKCDEEEQNVKCFNDFFLFNVIYPDDSKSNKDNDDNKIDIEQSLGGNVINTDDGAYAHGSNKLLETSHDTSNKFFKTENFIKELSVKIVTCNYLNKGMPFIFLIKNLYVPFGIPFDPKLFYKDEIKLGKSNIKAFLSTKVLAGRQPRIYLSVIEYVFPDCLYGLSKPHGYGVLTFLTLSSLYFQHSLYDVFIK
ncbi:hypothetical protein Tco_0799747 [Tanacetum coccineum]|uniref:Uncharacterized protein n=1 Tax=Tanacetum coccineum TaxID=301880 RepID=A0ABQ4ZR71_9ASTR